MASATARKRRLVNGFLRPLQRARWWPERNHVGVADDFDARAARLQKPLGNRVFVDLQGHPLPVMTAPDIAALEDR